MVPWNGARTKVQLKLSIQRTKMLQSKKEAMAKKARRDIAALVEKGKLETARIKTEGLIAEDIHIELLELMELYAETLLARFALLELQSREPDPSLTPALAALIHASPRTELRELHVLREMLMAKYGRDFALDVMDNRDGIVPDRVMAKLDLGSTGKVDAALVDAYIDTICKAYDVPFESEVLAKGAVEAERPSIGDEDETEQVQRASGTTTEGETETRTAPTDGKKPNPTASGETSISTTVGTDGDSGSAATSASVPPSTATTTTTTTTAKKPTEQDDYDSLAARFAALKRR